MLSRLRVLDMCAASCGMFAMRRDMLGRFRRDMLGRLRRDVLGGFRLG
jgi:hypothetical protein